MAVVVSAVAPGLNAEMYEAVTARAMPGDELPTDASFISLDPLSRDGASSRCGSRPKRSSGSARRSCFRQSERPPGATVHPASSRRSIQSTS